MKLYLHLYDLSMDNANPKCAQFIETYTGYDILGQIQAFAQRNCTDLSNIRAFVCESRKQWDSQMRDYVARVDWSRTTL